MQRRARYHRDERKETSQRALVFIERSPRALNAFLEMFFLLRGAEGLTEGTAGPSGHGSPRHLNFPGSRWGCLSGDTGITRGCPLRTQSAARISDR